MGDTVAERQGSRIVAHVQPNAAHTEVVDFKDGVLRVRISAPPVKGKANDELVRLLSRVLGVSKSDLIIEKGITAKRKTIAITGLGQEETMRLLDKR